MLPLFLLLIYWELNCVIYIIMVLAKVNEITVLVFILSCRAADKFLMNSWKQNWIGKFCWFELGRCCLIVPHNASLSTGQLNQLHQETFDFWWRYIILFLYVLILLFVACKRLTICWICIVVKGCSTPCHF